MGGCACTAKSARAGQACDESADVLQSPAQRPTPCLVSVRLEAGPLYDNLSIEG